MKPRITNRRRLQLRTAKQAQRKRERAQGLVHLQLALPAGLAVKLRLLQSKNALLPALEHFVDDLVVRVADYPALKQVSWGLHDEYITAREAFALYERNWKHLDRPHMEPHEEALLKTLTQRFGAGIILHA